MLTRNADFLKKAPLIGAFLCAGFLVADLQAACETRDYDDTATLDKVYDGDTIRLTDGRKVRIIAINTPEMAYKERPAQALAGEATAALKQMFQSSKRVYLKFGTERHDRYRRVLAHVFTEQGQNVAAELLHQGLGFAILVPPNDWQHACYARQEQHAVKRVKGIWANADYQPRSASKLTRNMTGFQLIEGRVGNIGYGKKWLWLDLVPKFSVKVLRRNLKYFDNPPIEALVGKKIRIRGWAAYYNGKLRMSLNHPAMMKLLD